MGWPKVRKKLAPMRPTKLLPVSATTGTPIHSACTAGSRRLGALSNSCDSGTARNTRDHSPMVVGDSFMALLNEPNTSGASAGRGAGNA